MLTSEILCPTILKCRLSFLNRAPLHVPQVTFSIKSSAHRCMERLFASLLWFAIKCMTPSKLTLYSLVTPIVLCSIVITSLVPCSMISRASSGISANAVSRLNPYFIAMISNWLKIQFFLYSPTGAKPPLRIVFLRSGMTLSKLTSLVVPIPSQ